MAQTLTLLPYLSSFRFQARKEDGDNLGRREHAGGPHRQEGACNLKSFPNLHATWCRAMNRQAFASTNTYSRPGQREEGTAEILSWLARACGPKLM